MEPLPLRKEKKLQNRMVVETNYLSDVEWLEPKTYSVLNLPNQKKELYFEEVEKVITSGMPKVDMIQTLLAKKLPGINTANDVFHIIKAVHEKMLSRLELQLEYNINLHVERYESKFFENTQFLSEDQPAGEDLKYLDNQLNLALQSIVQKEQVIGLGDPEKVEEVAKQIMIKDKFDENYKAMFEKSKLEKLWWILEKSRVQAARGIFPITLDETPVKVTKEDKKAQEKIVKEYVEFNKVEDKPKDSYKTKEDIKEKLEEDNTADELANFFKQRGIYSGSTPG